VDDCRRAADGGRSAGGGEASRGGALERMLAELAFDGQRTLPA
jgi:hypothetical protein